MILLLFAGIVVSSTGPGAPATRTVTVALESRAVTIAAESRTVTVTP